MSDRSSVSPADTGCSLTPIPCLQDALHDPHSSEEELEVINNPRSPTPLRTNSVCLPEKRKWSQISTIDVSPSENEENMSSYGNVGRMEIVGGKEILEHNSGSSDDEVRIVVAPLYLDLFTKML